MAQVGDAVGGDGAHYGGVLQVFGDEVVVEVVLGVPDLAVIEVIAAWIGLPERDCGHAVHCKVGVVRSAGAGGALLGFALALDYAEGDEGVVVLQGLAGLDKVVIHCGRDGDGHRR